MNPFIEHKHLLEKYLHKETIPFLQEAWNEPWRKYHGVNHLQDIIDILKESAHKVHPYDYESLLLAAFFHDCYYNPRDNKNNEDESIKRFVSSFKGDNRIRNSVIEMIQTTKHRKRPSSMLLRIFWDADNMGFNKGFKWLLENEKLIRKEYIHVPKKLYKKGRIEFLKSNIGLFNANADINIEKLIEYVNATY